ncbi:MAG: hypothetical protein AAGB48_01430 [Planctomycetota bacterium]
MRTPAFLIDTKPGPDQHHRLRIEPGERSNYRALAPLHYRPGHPATICRVLRAVETRRGELAGVLVSSRPTLNGLWRAHAWPGRYCDPDKRARARAINTGLRTISRVIVDPRYRGLSLAVRLVRAYLADPETEHTEAIAAMGAVCPFFERAGMRRLPAPAMPDRDRRLLAALRTADVEEAAERLLRKRTTPSPSLERALRTWSRANASTRRARGLTVDRLAALAAGALLAPPIAYAAERPKARSETGDGDHGPARKR